MRRHLFINEYLRTSDYMHFYRCQNRMLLFRSCFQSCQGGKVFSSLERPKNEGLREEKVNFPVSHRLFQASVDLFFEFFQSPYCSVQNSPKICVVFSLSTPFSEGNFRDLVSSFLQLKVMNECTFLYGNQLTFS